MKYRKKPVIIEAYQTDVELDIPTLEGTMHASVGDYIITGVRGEQYPCKPDIFRETYEPAEWDADGTAARETCTYEIAAYGDGKAWFACSKCGGMTSADYDPPKYCPHCGAKVVGE